MESSVSCSAFPAWGGKSNKSILRSYYNNVVKTHLHINGVLLDPEELLSWTMYKEIYNINY